MTEYLMKYCNNYFNKNKEPYVSMLDLGGNSIEIKDNIPLPTSVTHVFLIGGVNEGVYGVTGINSNMITTDLLQTSFVSEQEVYALYYIVAPKAFMDVVERAAKYVEESKLDIRRQSFGEVSTSFNTSNVESVFATELQPFKRMAALVSLTEKANKALNKEYKPLPPPEPPVFDFKGTATANTVLLGETFYSDSDVLRTGTLVPSIDPPELTGNAVESDVVEGVTFYSNDYQKRTGTLVVPTFNGNATAEDVAEGKTFYSGSPTLITGTYKPSAGGLTFPNNFIIPTSNLYMFQPKGYIYLHSVYLKDDYEFGAFEERYFSLIPDKTTDATGNPVANPFVYTDYNNPFKIYGGANEGLRFKFAVIYMNPKTGVPTFAPSAFSTTGTSGLMNISHAPITSASFGLKIVASSTAGEITLDGVEGVGASYTVYATTVSPKNGQEGFWVRLPLPLGSGALRTEYGEEKNLYAQINVPITVSSSYSRPTDS